MYNAAMVHTALLQHDKAAALFATVYAATHDTRVAAKLQAAQREAHTQRFNTHFQCGLEALHTGATDTAVDQFHACLELAQADYDSQSAGLAHWQLASAWAARGDMARAQQQLRQAISQDSSLRALAMADPLLRQLLDASDPAMPASLPATWGIQPPVAAPVPHSPPPRSSTPMASPASAGLSTPPAASRNLFHRRALPSEFASGSSLQLSDLASLHTPPGAGAPSSSASSSPAFHLPLSPAGPSRATSPMEAASSTSAASTPSASSLPRLQIRARATTCDIPGSLKLRERHASLAGWDGSDTPRPDFC